MDMDAEFGGMYASQGHAGPMQPHERKLSKFLIMFDNSNLLYFPGQFLSGRVIVELVDEMAITGEILTIGVRIRSVLVKFLGVFVTGVCVEVLREIVTVILFIPMISQVQPKMVWLCSGDKKKGELLQDVTHRCLVSVICVRVASLLTKVTFLAPQEENSNYRET